MESTQSFAAPVEMNRAVVEAFEEHERRDWTVETEVLELTKQVGDLTRAVLTFEGCYLADRDSAARYATDEERIADELADIFYCLLRIATVFGGSCRRPQEGSRTRVAAAERPSAAALGDGRIGQHLTVVGAQVVLVGWADVQMVPGRLNDAEHCWSGGFRSAQPGRVSRSRIDGDSFDAA